MKNCMGVLCWADLVCPVSCGCLFISSPGVLRSTVSHIWCKLNLLIVLLSVGLLTLMYIDSLIVLAMSWPSLPIILKFSCVVVWSVLWLCLCIGDGSSRCSLNLSPKVLEVSPCIPHHMQGLHIGASRWPHFYFSWVPCPWGKPGGF